MNNQHNRISQKPAATIDDAFTQAIGQRLQDRGIAEVPGLPRPAAPDWLDNAIEHERRYQEFLRQREQEHQAAVEAQEAPQTLPDLIRQMIAAAGKPVASDDTVEQPVQTSVAMPLNSAAILRAALGGTGGKINGKNE
jgi:hypothetical protein